MINEVLPEGSRSFSGRVDGPTSVFGWRYVVCRSRSFLFWRVRALQFNWSPPKWQIGVQTPSGTSFAELAMRGIFRKRLCPGKARGLDQK